MATNVDIGCESGSAPVLGLYEAIKKNGTQANITASTTQFVKDFTSSNKAKYLALAICVGDEQYVCITGLTVDRTYSTVMRFGSNPLTLNSDNYISFSVNERSNNSYRLNLGISGGNLGNYLSHGLEAYYIITNSYDQLMSQLGGA